MAGGGGSIAALARSVSSNSWSASPEAHATFFVAKWKKVAAGDHFPHRPAGWVAAGIEEGETRRTIAPLLTI
jgi:hypothetical protein